RLVINKRDGGNVSWFHGLSVGDKPLERKAGLVFVRRFRGAEEVFEPSRVSEIAVRESAQVEVVWQILPPARLRAGRARAAGLPDAGLCVWPGRDLRGGRRI